MRSQQEITLWFDQVTKGILLVMFETQPIPEARPIAVLKKLFVVVIVSLLVIGGFSSYRAYIQVKSLDIQADQVLVDGANIYMSVLTSGRTTVDVDVELIQGTYREKVYSLQVHGNELGFFDPRTIYVLDRRAMTGKQLAGFQTGAATLRATATGRHQWMRLPPPTVREITVQLRVE
jgi:hypothetical protein